MDPEALAAAFESLIRHPGAFVTAVTPEGIFVPIPPMVPVKRSRMLRGRSALDLVVAEDRDVVIRGWARARQVGGAHITVHLAAVPETSVPMHFFDLTSIHGMFFCVVIMPEGGDAGVRPDFAEGVTSRITWTKKSDNALFVDVDPGLERILGWTRDDLVGKRALDYIHPEDQELAIDNWMTMLASASDGQRVRLRHRHKNGEYVWVEISNKYLLDDPDDPHILAQMIDISDEMVAYEALREREQLLRRLAEALPSGLLHVRSSGEVVYTNERFHEIVGVSAAETIEAQLRTVVRDDWTKLETAFRTALEGVDADLEVRLRLPGADDVRLCHISMRSLSEADGTVTAAIISVDDVTESSRLRDELKIRATFDALTHCYNRSAIVQILEDAIAVPGERIAVVFIDLDRFKAINDELGHAAGDQLLVEAAERIRGVVRSVDFVGRIGGDEFLVVCPRVPNTDEAIDIAERVASVLRQEAKLDVGSVDMRASVGVAWSSRDITDTDELVARADAAMYESKRRGVGRPVAFTPALRRADNVKVQDERALHQALERGDLAVHFQPIVRLSTGQPIGYESLVRWTRGLQDLVASEFIEMAEVTGLIHELGALVRQDLLESVAENANLADEGLLWFSNVSVQELLMPGFVPTMLAAIDEASMSRESFVVEFRSNMNPEALEVASRRLRELHDAGVGLALDDFGGASSSMEVLRSLPLQWVKLSASFTNEMTRDPVARSIVESLLNLSSRVGTAAIAKGVETDEQRTMLLGMGAELGQGYLWTPAAPLNTLLSPG